MSSASPETKLIIMKNLTTISKLTLLRLLLFLS